VKLPGSVGDGIFTDNAAERKSLCRVLIRRKAFEVACVVADRRPGMLRDDASDFICVSRDQANLSLG